MSEVIICEHDCDQTECPTCRTIAGRATAKYVLYGQPDCGHPRCEPCTKRREEWASENQLIDKALEEGSYVKIDWKGEIIADLQRRLSDTRRELDWFKSIYPNHPKYPGEK